MRFPNVLLVLAVTTFAATMLFLPPIVQWQTYHNFADQRELLKGVPNTLNVISNVAFMVAAAFGFAALRGSDRFRKPHERIDAIVFFTGIALAGVGSTIYHLRPSDASLAYDRAGMTLGFMALLAMLVDEHFSAGKWILPTLSAIGLGSIAWWRIEGDLRPYGWVQFFPILAVVLIAAIGKAAYSYERTTLVTMFVLYGFAKLFEATDRAIYMGSAGVISGHTLKHLAAACAAIAVSFWIHRRTTLSPARDEEAMAVTTG